MSDNWKDAIKVFLDAVMVGDVDPMELGDWMKGFQSKWYEDWAYLGYLAARAQWPLPPEAVGNVVMAVDEITKKSRKKEAFPHVDPLKQKLIWRQLEPFHWMSWISAEDIYPWDSMEEDALYVTEEILEGKGVCVWELPFQWNVDGPPYAFTFDIPEKKDWEKLYHQHIEDFKADIAEYEEGQWDYDSVLDDLEEGELPSGFDVHWLKLPEDWSDQVDWMYYVQQFVEDYYPEFSEEFEDDYEA
jgi:hypothetical protein